MRFFPARRAIFSLIKYTSLAFIITVTELMLAPNVVVLPLYLVPPQ